MILVEHWVLWMESEGDYNVVPKWFNEIQMSPFMAKCSETNLKKKALLKQNQKCPKIMPLDH